MFDKVWEERYEILQQLGKKAGRRTLLAGDRQNQELVVIKLLSFGNDVEWDDFKLFEREAKTLKNLSHPAIPRYLDYFEVNSPNNKGFALVQSYIAAKSLEEQFKAGRTFTESEVQEIAKDILRILTYLHQHQPPIIHRDIKPSNILLTNSSTGGKGEVYLVDFGSVQNIAAKEGGTVTVVGTYGYMPPEQFGGRAVPASDLYSLGATLIYLITGTHPADLPQTDFRIEFEQFTNISPGFSRWLKLLTEPSLERRLNSAEAALKALENPLALDTISLVRQKPPGSAVILNKKSDSLKITVSHTFKLLSIIWIPILMLMSFSIFLTMIATMIFMMPFGIFLTLLALPLWVVTVELLLDTIFKGFGQSVLHINQQQISLIHELLGFKLGFRPGIFTLFGSSFYFSHSSPLPRKDISRLVVYLKEDYPCAIGIWARMQEYKFGHGLSVAEIDWLATELSDWLKLPIRTKKIPKKVH